MVFALRRRHRVGSSAPFVRPPAIDLFTDTAAILISIVSNGYYGMPREQIHINLPPEHPIMSFETIEIKMATVSAKRSIVHCGIVIYRCQTLITRRKPANLWGQPMGNKQKILEKV